MHLYHEGLMIGVQHQLMICIDILEHLRVHFNFFLVDGSMANSHFCLILHFSLHFRSNLKGL